MPESLFFVHEDEALLDEMSTPYRERGWGVETSSPLDPDALDRIVAANPLAAIFCLDSECSEDTTALARQLAEDPRGTRPLVVFVDGDAETCAAAKQAVPVGVAVRLEELPWVLKHLAYKG